MKRLVFLVVLLLVVLDAGAVSAASGKNNPLIPPAFTIPQSIGVHAFNFFNGQGEIGQFTGSGARLWRSEFRWAWFETKKGVYDFSEYDRIMKQCRENDITCLFIIYGANPLYPEFPSSGEATIMTSGPQLEGFAKYAGEAAKYLKGKRVILELGNEPDGSGQPPPESYVAYAKAAATAMRAADPNVCIVGPAAHHYALEWLEQVFQQGFLDCVDAVSIHLYTGGRPEDPQPKPEDNTPRVAAVRALVDKYSNGRKIPLINSEWGYDRITPGGPNKDYNVTVDQQMQYAARFYLLAALWDLRISTWFTWYLAPSYDISGYSLLSPDWAPMPVYYAIRNLKDQLPNGTLTRRMDVGSADDYVLEFKTAKGIRWAVWTAAGGQTVKIPAGKARKMTVTDVSGTRAYEVPVKDGYASVGLSQVVQYLK